MKSIIITSNAYHPNIGGVENSLRYLATSFTSLGYKVHVIVSDVTSSGEKLPHYEEFEDVAIYRYTSYSGFFSKVVGIKAIFSAFNAVKLMTRLHRENDIELTLSRFHTTTVFAKLARLPKVIYLIPGVVKYQKFCKKFSV